MNNQKSSSDSNLRFIKSVKDGNTTIEVYAETPSENELRNVLIHIYDVINELAANVESRGGDVSKWFYTDKQLEKLKKDKKCKFI